MAHKVSDNETAKEAAHKPKAAHPTGAGPVEQMARVHLVQFRRAVRDSDRATPVSSRPSSPSARRATDTSRKPTGRQNKWSVVMRFANAEEESQSICYSKWRGSTERNNPCDNTNLSSVMRLLCTLTMFP